MQIRGQKTCFQPWHHAYCLTAQFNVLPPVLRLHVCPRLTKHGAVQLSKFILLCKDVKVWMLPFWREESLLQLLELIGIRFTRTFNPHHARVVGGLWGSALGLENRGSWAAGPPPSSLLQEKHLLFHFSLSTLTISASQASSPLCLPPPFFITSVLSLHFLPSTIETSVLNLQGWSKCFLGLFKRKNNDNCFCLFC